MKSWWRLSTRKEDSKSGYRTTHASTKSKNYGVSSENIEELAALAKKLSKETSIPTCRIDVTECTMCENTLEDWTEENYGCVEEYCSNEECDINSFSN